ncbi:hypothetical protein J7W19_31930 [Streptomyces mobaraensis NBRC 13819 = DSM 40847]|uniref:hypothetical protein n=1 Tax=Streptomyces mobaraensis TaxID=35621 RepID=UPI00034C14CE|nr:hypothetical protein [Streptomyces mobaraensis]QTT77379.1 hypothetical protein J7W19_31930 [Streptomyces mobaraensis NBRC 13819 = DSM 40847]
MPERRGAAVDENVLALQELPEAEAPAREPWMCCDTAETSWDITDPPRCPLF